MMSELHWNSFGLDAKNSGRNSNLVKMAAEVLSVASMITEGARERKELEELQKRW
jgi:hypothetical protein